MTAKETFSRQIYSIFSPFRKRVSCKLALIHPPPRKKTALSFNMWENSQGSQYFFGHNFLTGSCSFFANAVSVTVIRTDTNSFSAKFLVAWIQSENDFAVYGKLFQKSTKNRTSEVSMTLFLSFSPRQKQKPHFSHTREIEALFCGLNAFFICVSSRRYFSPVQHYFL